MAEQPQKGLEKARVSHTRTYAQACGRVLQADAHAAARAKRGRGPQRFYARNLDELVKNNETFKLSALADISDKGVVLGGKISFVSNGYFGSAVRGAPKSGRGYARRQNR